MGAHPTQGLRVARLLMVISSLSPLFFLWAIRGSPSIPDFYWIPGCIAFIVIPNLTLLLRWRIAQKRNDHRTVVVSSARDQGEHLLVYLFAMLLPLYTSNLASERELLAVAAAFFFIVFLFWHLNLHYMNVAFAIFGYRVYTISMATRSPAPPITIILLSKRADSPRPNDTIATLRLSDTVFIER